MKDKEACQKCQKIKKYGTHPQNCAKVGVIIPKKCLTLQPKQCPAALTGLLNDRVRQEADKKTP